MNSHYFVRFASLGAFVLASVSFAFADTAETVARTAAIVQRVMELNQQFAAYDAELPAPAPLAGAKGKYLLPINADGTLTAWAEKALNAQVGNIAGEQAGAAAGKGLASVVPGGGLASGFLKKKGKETGAMAALGGADFVRKNTVYSFDSVEAYAVFLHAKAGKSADYSKAVQAAIALYPDLESSYAASVQTAFNAAAKDAQIRKAAAEALAAKEAAEKDAAAKLAVVATAAAAVAEAPAVQAVAAP